MRALRERVVGRSLSERSFRISFAGSGATVCLAPWSFTLRHLRRSVELTRATHACSTPSVWALYDLSLDPEQAQAKAGTLTTIMLGGEPMRAVMIRAWLALGVRLINTYGTTEATVYQWAYELPSHAASLSDTELEKQARCLGAPFDGIGFAVAPSPEQLEDLVASRCDAQAVGGDDVGGDDVGLGVGQGGEDSSQDASQDASGELVLWGVQVGGADRWAPPEADAVGGGERTPSDDCRFPTGDLVRRQGDALFYLGRADQQVKLNGRRIELGPIGAAICAAMKPLVRDAVVQLIDGRLHTFCVMSVPPAEDRASAGYSLTSAAVRMLSALELPSHLVPPGVTLLGELPKTPTGKTDARALAVLAHDPATAPSVGREMEEGRGDGVSHGRAAWKPEGWLGVVAACWSLELGLPVCQLSDSSDFRALSGDSLTALKICGRLWRHQTAGREEGGAFGELMGAFAPAHLMGTPILSEYALMLQAAVSAATVNPHGADDGRGGLGNGQRADAACTGADAAPASEAEALAVRTAVAGEVGLLQVLLSQHPQLSSGPAVDRLLLAALSADQGECAALMLRHGASPNATSPCGAITALMSATQHKDTVSVNRLLASCACVSTLDQNQQTALHHAARVGADNSCLEALLAGDGDGTVTLCGSLDVWGRSPLHWAAMNGHREAIVALVEAGCQILLPDLQNESSLDLAERRAQCKDVAATGKCDRLTVDLLRLILPRDHAEHRSFHAEGFMDLCTYEVLGHAARLNMSATEREVLLAMSPEERAAIGDHVMTIDELNARGAAISEETPKERTHRVEDAYLGLALACNMP